MRGDWKLRVDSVSLLRVLVDCFMTRGYLTGKRLRTADLRSSMSTLRLRNLATLSIEQQLADEMNFDIAIEEFANKTQEKLLCIKL